MKPTTIKEMAAMGGKARAKKLSRQRRVAIARNAINTRWRRAKAQVARDNKESKQTTTSNIRTTLGRHALVVVAALCLASAANAYTLESGAVWWPGNVTFDVNLGPYSSVAASEMAQWNQYTGSTHLRAVEVTTNNFAWADNENSIVWSTDANFSLASNILAVCGLSRIDWTTGRILEADIIVNSNFLWSSYDGNFRRDRMGNVIYDIGRLLLHEEGHAIGLGHSSYDTIMSPYVGNLWQLTDDDIAGAKFLYSQPRNVPESGSTAVLLCAGLVALCLAKMSYCSAGRH